MITDGKKWHYLAVTNLSALLQGNSSNHEGDFYCLNCFNSYTTKNKLKEHEEIFNIHDSCRIELPKRVKKILKYNPGEKSLKVPFTIYLDLECLLKKEQSRQNNPAKSYTDKKARHEPSGWAIFTKHSVDKKESKLNYYGGKFRRAFYSKCNLNYKVPKDISILIYNASYDTHFIINKLAEGFKDESNYIRENQEKYITFFVPIKKQCDDNKTIAYKLSFIDRFRFMSTSLSELIDNMSGHFNSIECKSCTENNRCEEYKILIED